jgi:ABC-type transport system involved in multi-copper enzyme maturation permease subunit
MEGLKLWLRWRLWLGLLITLLPGILFLMISFYAGRSVVPVQVVIWPGGLTSMLAFANGYFAGAGYVAYFFAIITTLMISQEYSWRTMQLWLSRGASRPLLLTAKFALALLCLLVTGIAFSLVGSMVALIQAYQLNGGVTIQGSEIGVVLLNTLRTTYGVLPYVALAFLLAVAGRSLMTVIALPLYMIVIELPLNIFLPMFGMGKLVSYLPVGLAQTLNYQNYVTAHMNTQGLSGSEGDPSVALILIPVYTVVFFGAALWIFQRQDLNS